MVAALLLACGAKPTIDLVDEGCACIEPGPIVKVHLACVDCLDSAAIVSHCEVTVDDEAIRVTASATITGPCPDDGACAPLVVQCQDVPVPGPTIQKLVYGGTEASLSVPLPRTAVCACPGSMPTRTQ